MTAQLGVNVGGVWAAQMQEICGHRGHSEFFPAFLVIFRNCSLFGVVCYWARSMRPSDRPSNIVPLAFV